MIRLPWRSRITRIRANSLVTYGIPQERIIKSFSYEEMVYLLIFGKKPSRVERIMLRSVILSHCSHGITGQSTLAVRMGADCHSPFLNSVLASFLVGSGPVHQGGLEATMRELQRAVNSRDVKSYVQDKLANKEIVYGYGHRFHSYDPRARTLIKLCKQHSFVGPFVRAAMKIDRLLWKSKRVRMNIEAACGSILLEMGFPPQIASLIILIGRGPMLAAAYLERLQSARRPFQRIQVFDLVKSNGKSR